MEEVKTAETTVQTEDGVHADVDQNQVSENEVLFEEENGEEVGQSDTPSEEPKSDPKPKTQSKEEQAENARRRREEQRKVELKGARTKAFIEALDGVNPFTHEEMKDEADVEEYLAMKEIERQGGDPLHDYAKYLKQKERQKAEEARKQEAEKEWYRKDQESFVKKYPSVNLQELIGNARFQNYASGKVGRVPLTEIYEGYSDMLAEYETKAENKAKQILANAKATPGALSSTNPPESGFFTREQVQKMSPEEVHKHYDDIIKSRQKWK